MRITGPSGDEITSIEAWRRAMPVRVREHWTKDRSARSLAEAWFRGDAAALPAELLALLGSRPETSGFVAEEVLPERVTKLDDFRGGRRNHDVLVVGRAAGERVVVAVEAKADEPLGPTLTKQVASPRKGSNKVARRDQLVQALFGSPKEEGIENLRYQLFTAAVGAAIEAERHEAHVGVLVIQVFRPPHPSKGSLKRLQTNAQDVADFLAALGVPEMRDGELVGPLILHRTPSPPPLYVGAIESPLP